MKDILASKQQIKSLNNSKSNVINQYEKTMLKKKSNLNDDLNFLKKIALESGVNAEVVKR